MTDIESRWFQNFERMSTASHHIVREEVRGLAEEYSCEILAGIDTSMEDSSVRRVINIILASGCEKLVDVALEFLPGVFEIPTYEPHPRPDYSSRDEASKRWEGARPYKNAAELWRWFNNLTIENGFGNGFKLMQHRGHLSQTNTDKPFIAMMASIALLEDLAWEKQEDALSVRNAVWRLNHANSELAAFLPHIDNRLKIFLDEIWEEAYNKRRKLDSLPILKELAGPAMTAKCLMLGALEGMKKNGLASNPVQSNHDAFRIISQLPKLEIYNTLNDDERLSSIVKLFPKINGKPHAIRKSPDDKFSPEAIAKRKAREEKRAKSLADNT